MEIKIHTTELTPIQKYAQNYLERFKKLKVAYVQTVFPPVWENLKNGMCPLCGCKLKKPLGKSITLCNSKRHKHPFVITNKVLSEIIK